MKAQLQNRVKAEISPFLTPASSKLLQRKCACGSHTLCDECEDCKSEKGLLPRTSLSPRAEGGEAIPSIVHDVLRSPGEPLDPVTRSFIEPRYGHDFSRVRVHTDAKAAESAQAIDALAYTVGQDIVFKSGAYQPGTST